MKTTSNSKNKGVTLIALIITIIVLLILAGVSISLVVGDNGIVNKSQNAASETNKAQIQEEIQLAYSNAKLDKYDSSKDAEMATLIKTELEKTYGEGKVTVEENDDGDYIVTISGEKYIVGNDGVSKVVSE
jgi:Tfp pilus assembly protein PilE